jgi:uncharacterized C2H2 Zn-finger protein
MVNYYDELEIEDFAWDPVANVFHYPCPCGDRFEITKSQLRDGEEIAICPSCSLIVRVIYDYVSRQSIHELIKTARLGRLRLECRGRCRGRSSQRRRIARHHRVPLV